MLLRVRKDLRKGIAASAREARRYSAICCACAEVERLPLCLRHADVFRHAVMLISQFCATPRVSPRTAGCAVPVRQPRHATMPHDADVVRRPLVREARQYTRH